MKRSWPARGYWSGVLVAAIAATSWTAAQAQKPASGNTGGSGSWREVGVAEYRTHLEELDRLVTDCRKQRSEDACDPANVGSDDGVQVSPGLTREVRYNWLRDLLDSARKEEEPKKTESVNATPSSPLGQLAKAPPVSVDELLGQARERLSEDWKQAGGGVAAGSGYGAERNALTAILARKAYKGVSESSSRERFVEWLENKLADLLSKLAQFGSRSPWIAFALRALLLSAICIGLVWMLIRIERRSRIRLVPEPPAVADAPSAREWQLWLADARAMAGQGLWREAIHFMYWAAIARLESRRLWPADRARTPREYLRLLPAADARRTNLTALTRSFERTWYGGREAGAADFEAAEKLAAELGVE